MLLAENGKDAMDFMNKCYDCKIFGNRIHALIVSLHPVSSPTHFIRWHWTLLARYLELPRVGFGY